jgi:hypothetical protein
LLEKNGLDSWLFIHKNGGVVWERNMEKERNEWWFWQGIKSYVEKL